MMQSRKQINDQIVRWIKNRIKTKYPDDVSLVLLYGSYVNDTANRLSDVDCYYIPRTDRGCEIGRSFILEGVGYDLFPMSWERVEGLAALKEDLLPCVGDVQVLYYHSEEELERFRQLQSKQKQNLQDSGYVKSIAHEKFKTACGWFAEMQAATDTVEIKTRAGNLIMWLADAMALYHHDYFHFGLKCQFEDLQTKIPGIPEEFIKEYAGVLEAPNNTACVDHCGNLLKITAEHMGFELEIPTFAQIETAPEKSRPDYQWLAELYEEISSTFNKIYICCENENYPLAFLSAVCLQRELSWAVEHGGQKYDLLSSYRHSDLPRLAAKAKEIENDYLQRVADGGGIIKRYDSFEDFLKADL